MTKSKKLLIAPFILGLLFSGCSGSSNKDKDLTSALQQKQVSATETNGVVVHDCGVPALISQNPAASGTVVDVSHLPQSVSGTFELDKLLLFSTQTSTSGVKTDILSAGVQVQRKSNELRDTQLQHFCNQSASGAEGLTQSIAAVLVAHFPSARVTVYDQGDPLDVPQTNYAEHAQLIASSSGHESFEMTSKDKTPPFTTDLMFSDWIARLPARPVFTVLPDGSFEARVHWTRNKPAQDSSAYFHFQKKR